MFSLIGADINLCKSYCFYSTLSFTPFQTYAFLMKFEPRQFILSFKVEVTSCIWFNGLVPARLVTETRLLHNWAEKQLEDNSLSGFGATDPFVDVWVESCYFGLIEILCWGFEPWPLICFEIDSRIIFCCSLCHDAGLWSTGLLHNQEDTSLRPAMDSWQIDDCTN